MKWESLFNPNRAGVSYTKEIDLQTTRSAFIKDYDRILFSAPFRKLQNKTQVFPLTDNIFVHNRLTHSLETASVGRTLGREVGKALAAKHKSGPVFEHFYENELQHVVSAACLAHDIGNPAFGHSGESAISEYFRHNNDSRTLSFKNHMTEAQWNELSHFEGNANGFRILTHNFNNSSGGEFKLTYSTLAALVKYPCRSIDGNDKSTGLISTKKYNIHLSEWDQWKKIANGLNIPSAGANENVYFRHPFVYLVEAADDICYLIIDLEDAHRLGLASHKETYGHMLELLYAFSEKSGSNAEDQTAKITSEDQKIAYLRALVIHAAINKCVEVFMAHEAELLAGNLQKSLTGLFPSPLKEKWEALESFSFKNIYSHPKVIEREIAGYKVLQGLLEEFLTTIFHKGSLRTRQLNSLIPYPYQNLTDENDHYMNVRSILDYLSALTDQEAIGLFRLLKGIEV